MKLRVANLGKCAGRPSACRAPNRVAAGPLRRRSSRWRSPVLAFVAVLVVAGKTWAVDVASEFAAANKLYAEGQFPEAAALYEKILQSGCQSPALWFNEGNAEFKAGHPGKAIAAYRRARLLAPRDADIRANLDFVRQQVSGAPVPQSRWRVGLEELTLNEWTVLAALAFWLTFLSFTAQQLRPSLAPRLRRATFVLICLTVLLCGATGLQAVEHFSQSIAVVVVRGAVARSGPFQDAQQVFAVSDGAELSAREHHGDWIQVINNAGEIGWLPLNEVELVPAA